MKEKILKEFTNLYNNQDLLSNLMNEDLFDNYSNTEVHCVDAIGKLEKANGVNISKKLNMTRGAISKLTRKLENKNVIYRDTLEDNKKEVLYKLTDEGEKLFKKHTLAHEKWEKRDLEYLNSFDEENLKIVLDFVEHFNIYLKSIIEENEKL